MNDLGSRMTDTGALAPHRSGRADVGRGITLAYEAFGDPAQPALLLVMGLGMQLTGWPEAMVGQLVARGFYVVRFDNRDAGLSTQLDGQRGTPVPMAILRARLGLSVQAPYLLHDMARDVIGLMDALQIERAHIVGASMGGMIAQLVGSGFAPRVRSLVLVMTNSGDPKAGTPEWGAAAALMKRPPPRATLEQLVEHYFKVFRVIGSPPGPHQMPDDALRERLHNNFRRAFRPAGTYRQLLAIIASGDRSHDLRRLTTPTLVLHGADDPLVPVSSARDLARKIPHAQLAIIEHMGHDLGPLARITDEIGSFCSTH
jgi:proline iminopeptidase